ncbi:MAG: hypothetical protein H6972_12320 [Gammaproteobacteria bacterium]|nr:hypothetical protein [Gammaproteobacteria bacterium]
MSAAWRIASVINGFFWVKTSATRAAGTPASIRRIPALNRALPVRDARLSRIILFYSNITYVSYGSPFQTTLVTPTL